MKIPAAVMAFTAVLCLPGCSTSRPNQPAKATEDVNKQHIKGTTDVLRNYRFGESPKGSKKSK